MSDIKFTTEQEAAISLRNKNLLVSASAGTGKTAVLVERIIRMAVDGENPVDLDRMLIVTFTNAASEEMRERIRNALYSEIKKNPGNSRLHRQLILLGQANISTIHSFCSEVIRSNYHLLDIDPGFIVCDANEAGLYLEEAMNIVLSKAYETGGSAFEMLVDGYGQGKDDERLSELIRKIYEKVRSMPGYRTWLVEKANVFNSNKDDFSKSKWGRLILDYSAARIKGYLEDISGLLEIIEDDEAFSGYYKTLAEEEHMLSSMHDKLREKSWDYCNSAFTGVVFNTIGRIKKGASEQVKNRIKDTRDAYKKEVGKIGARLSGSSQEIYDNMKLMAPMMEKLAELINELDREYRSVKNKNGVVDYSDLEHYALQCLENEAGKMYRDRFDEIFVDEYQDSNQIQETIVNLVSGRSGNSRNLFMVGDVKQSIYKFRQADPSLFVKKYKSYSESMDEEEVRVELFRNYRSRKPILDFTNYIFAQIMSDKVGDIEYEKKVFLLQGKSYPKGNDEGYPVELKLVCGEDKELFPKDISSNTKEAAVVGGEIIRIINSGLLITDKSTGDERPAQYRDMTILIRNANMVAAEYVRQLKKMGIPVYAESNSDFFKEREIIIIKSFIEIIDNPRQDIPLLALLRSSIFGFTDKELAFIRSGSRYGSYYDSLLGFSSNKQLKNKIDKFLETIKSFRHDAINMSVDKLIWRIMHETGFYNQCIPGDNAGIRQKNLRRFFEIAGSYEKGRATGVFGFIRYLNNYSVSGGKEGTTASNESSNVVRLMSVHKSKGLEFSIVFFAGCGKSFNKREKSENLVIDREYGFGPEYINARGGFKFTTAVKKSIQIKKEVDGLAEEMRVLYVALTRACEKLVITGYVKNFSKASDKWYLRGRRKNGKIDPGKVMLASGCLDWIMTSVLNHKNSKNILDKMQFEQSEADSGPPFFKINSFLPFEIFNLLNSRVSAKAEDKAVIKIGFNEVKERFEWEYPYSAGSGFHKKVSVTELKKLRENQNGEKDIFGTDFIRQPEYMGKKTRNTAIERGTLLHNVIAALVPERAFDEEYIKNLFIKSDAAKEELDGLAAIVIDFFRSDLGKRVLTSQYAVSEKAFLFPVLTKELYPANKNLPDAGHITLVQGVIDCMFYENGGYVIVDYKSDNVLSGNEQVHAAKYALQLNLYAEAIEKLTGEKVKEKYIYFLDNRVEVRLL